MIASRPAPLEPVVLKFLTAKEAADHHGFDCEAPFAYVGEREWLATPPAGGGNPVKHWRTVCCSWETDCWLCSFLVDGELVDSFGHIDMETALTIARDFVAGGRTWAVETK